MTTMFTHKTTDAWDALTIGIIEAGFRITATWPVKTESDSSLNIRDRAAARSTILLACRPQTSRTAGGSSWEQVEREVADGGKRAPAQAGGIRSATLGRLPGSLSDPRLRSFQTTGLYEGSSPIPDGPTNPLRLHPMTRYRWLAERCSQLAAAESAIYGPTTQATL